MKLPIVLSLLTVGGHCFSTKFKRHAAKERYRTDPNHPSFEARADGDGSVNLNDIHDLLYLANVTIDGSDFALQLDSGSSDLVLMAELPSVQPSSISLNLTYGVGYAYGKISNASVSFADLSISSQALLVSSSYSNPVTAFGASGIFGLGFTSLSSIDAAVKGTGASWGGSFLLNSFALTPTEPNYITFSLIRSPNGTTSDDGGFTVGEVDPEFSSVESTEPISTWPVSAPTRWSILIDSYETLSSNGTFKSAVPNVPSGKAVMLLDTGTSYVYAPEPLVTAMYKSVPGATYSSNDGQWNVPCDQQVFLGLWIGSRRFDMHPLDLVMPSLSDSTKCAGSFIPQTLAVGSGEFDIIAGDVFLRNAFTLFDFGDYTDSTNLTMGDPYIKMIPTTNITAASIEFNQDRGGSSTLPINPAATSSQPSSSPSSSSPTSSGITLGQLSAKIDHLESMQTIFYAVLGVNAVIMLSVVGFGLYFCCWRRKKSLSGEENALGMRRGKIGRSGKGYEGNTTSTMKLTGPAPDEAGAYRSVSLQNPDGEVSTQNASMYDTTGRHSTVSFRTDPYRHSRNLSNVSALRPLVPTTGAAITTRDPGTPGSEAAFRDMEMPSSPTSPARARVSSVPTSSDAYHRNNAMPAERYRQSSFGTATAISIPEIGITTAGRLSSPLATPQDELELNLLVPAGGAHDIPRAVPAPGSTAQPGASDFPVSDRNSAMPFPSSHQTTLTPPVTNLRSPLRAQASELSSSGFSPLAQNSEGELLPAPSPSFHGSQSSHRQSARPAPRTNASAGSEDFRRSAAL